MWVGALLLKISSAFAERKAGGGRTVRAAKGDEIFNSELNRCAVLGYDRADRSDGVAGQCESRYALQFDMPMR